MGLEYYGIKKTVIKELGSVALIKPYLDLLKIAKTIDAIVPMERDRDLTHGEVIETLVANRLDAPMPLLHIQEWAEDSGIEETFGIAPDRLNDDRLGRALDAISPHIEDIQNIIALGLIERYGIDPNLILWDTTSCYFEGDYEDSEFIKLACSRDNKPDKKQAVIGLNVSKEGIPLAHSILPGNSNDKKEALNNVKILQKNLKTKDLLMICDRAAFTKQNIPILQEKHIKYLGPFAAAEKEFILSIKEEEFLPIDYVTSKGRYGYFGVEKILCFDYNGKTYTTRALVVKSEEKAMLAAKTREKHMAKITAGLDHIRSKLNTRKYKKLDYVKQQIDKLFSRKKRYRSIYNIELSGSDGNLTLNWAINEEYLRQEKRADGKYILVTNLPEEEYPSSVLLQLYKSRHLNESRFRAFKSDLKVRPVFLKTDDRIKALLFINILALTVYCLVEWLCRKNNMYVTARVVLKKLKKIKFVEFHMADGKKIVQLANVDEEVKMFFSVMGVKLPYTTGRFNLCLIFKPGCSAESHVSHVLSERLSRGPISWSKLGAHKMAQLRAIKASGISLKNAVLKQQYETLKPIELPKQTLYKAKRQLKKIQSAYGTITNLPILLNKKTFTSMAIKSLLSQCMI